MPETTSAVEPAGPVSPHALLFVFITLTINAMGIGLMMPVMPALMTELTELPVSEAARWGGAISVVYALMQFLCGPTLGNLSDRFGRRPVLLISMFAIAIDYLVMALSWHLAILFVARIISGIAGATMSAATAFIADISAKEDRAKNFGLVGAGFGVGFVLGPIIGGLLGEYGTRAPFYAAAALSFLNFVFGLVMLPETLKPENKRPFDWRRANPFGALKQIAKYPAVQILILGLFLFDVAHYVYPAVWSYYAERVFGWSPGDIGLSLAMVGIGYALVQGVLIRYLEPRLGVSRTLLLGLGANLVAFTGLTFATEGWMAYALIGFAALGALATPAFTGLLSNLMPDNAQGEMQGLISSAAGLAMVISPFVMTQVFAVFAAPDAAVSLPGAPFALAALLILAVFAIVLPYLRRTAPAPSPSSSSENPAE
ncbi:MFS transporter [Roseibium denhamense]|uniref:MFS transporter, DHA1 family, tetracycline resistance protein n=1 Tax=Roseibium denhamense TaxID=76305 RepID=A0ABY1P1B3_9HYPH|nr:TCR/Tet family MFS transporter [Roseibium denhamense]MTI05135.1 MFS transporter [Roseibium denhamense]SMP22474.1 MFS transporter, DHA1 family, tetracycline resistance protein [Roseibium denhamense]